MLVVIEVFLYVRRIIMTDRQLLEDMYGKMQSMEDKIEDMQDSIL